ncbi:MAG: hypothetical protein HDT28_01965 [Clostridiales bacterium]|nr:hypothetical protein [Clostridiales bacterium]
MEFIELTNADDGKKVLLNANQILEVSTYADGKVFIEATIVGRERKTGEIVTYRFECNESYEEVKKLLNVARDRYVYSDFLLKALDKIERDQGYPPIYVDITLLYTLAEEIRLSEVTA